jgi:hypothetical protein
MITLSIVHPLDAVDKDEFDEIENENGSPCELLSTDAEDDMIGCEDHECDMMGRAGHLFDMHVCLQIRKMNILTPRSPLVERNTCPASHGSLMIILTHSSCL